MNWKDFFREQEKQEYMQRLEKSVTNIYKISTVFPPKSEIFNAFKLSPLDITKVVIVGQDPYHGEGEAHGLAFSVKDGVSIPPSLKNIFKEIKSDIGSEIPKTGNLTRWANQGVLLMNSILTVKKDSPGSHRQMGWEVLTDEAISLLSEKKDHLVFMLWGSHARSKSHLINTHKHLILESTHPSPFSASNGFFGCSHFSKCNKYLLLNGETPISW